MTEAVVEIIGGNKYQDPFQICLDFSLISDFILFYLFIYFFLHNMSGLKQLFELNKVTRGKNCNSHLKNELAPQLEILYKSTVNSQIRARSFCHSFFLIQLKFIFNSVTINQTNVNEAVLFFNARFYLTAAMFIDR